MHAGSVLAPIGPDMGYGWEIHKATLRMLHKNLQFSTDAGASLKPDETTTRNPAGALARASYHIVA